MLGTATVTQAASCFRFKDFGALTNYMQKALKVSAFEIGLLVSSAQIVLVVGLLIARKLLDWFGEQLIVGVGA